MNLGVPKKRAKRSAWTPTVSPPKGLLWSAGGVVVGAGAAVGAVAVLVRSVGGADFRLPHTGATAYAPNVAKIPAAAVTAEDAEMLKVLGDFPAEMKRTLESR